MKKILGFILTFLLIAIIIFIATFQYSRSWENAFFIEPLYKISTTEKVVALTFDDGPSETRTPALLKLLDKYDLKATFFMLGENIEKYPHIAYDVYQREHLIGNHSYNHPHLVFKSPSFIKAQVEKTDQLLKSLGLNDVQYFRPPYTSKYIILPIVLNSLDKKLVTGTYDPPSQYSSPFNAVAVSNEVISNTEPGTIIYLHDGLNHDAEAFVESVELIITGLKNKGFSFIRLDYEQYQE